MRVNAKKTKEEEALEGREMPKSFGLRRILLMKESFEESTRPSKITLKTFSDQQADNR